jgi:putative membrane protein
VRFAAERTLLAWIRTGLALMAFGFVVARFGLFLRELALARQASAEQSTAVSQWLGVGLVVLGVSVLLFAAGQHRRILQRLQRGEPLEPPLWSLGIAVAVVLAVVGLAMVAYLALVGHWGGFLFGGTIRTHRTYCEDRLSRPSETLTWKNGPP